MKAAHYLEDSEFLAFCRVWEKEIRIPLSMSDWFRDRGMEAQAERADWAFNQEDREVHRDEQNRQGGPTPRYHPSESEDSGPYYFWMPNVDGSQADDLPIKDNAPEWRLFYAGHDSFPEAIVVFLDNFPVPIKEKV